MLNRATPRPKGGSAALRMSKTVSTYRTLEPGSIGDRMPGTFSKMKNTNVPRMPSSITQSTTLSKTAARASDWPLRLPLLLQGGHGGPLINPWASESMSKGTSS
eukprot:11205916-Lingulodinium_polyedra.AAC.2